MYKSKTFLIRASCTVLFLVIVGDMGYTYFNYRKLLNLEDLKEVAIDLSKYTNSFMYNFGEEDLAKRENLQKLVSFIEKSSIVLDLHKDLLQYGYEFKFYEKSNSYLFCLYGRDGKKSEKNILIINDSRDRKLFENEELQIVEKPPFLNYYLNRNDFDILLFGYIKNGNCTNRPNAKYIFRDGNLSLYPDNKEKKKILLGLKKLENDLRINAEYALKEYNKPIFFKYDMKKVSILCDTLAPKKELQQIRDNLQAMFDSIEPREIDFGVFPVKISDSLYQSLK